MSDHCTVHEPVPRSNEKTLQLRLDEALHRNEVLKAHLSHREAVVRRMAYELRVAKGIDVTVNPEGQS